MKQDRARKIWYLAPVGLLLLLMTVGLMALRPPDSLRGWLLRGGALLGYQIIFLTIITSVYMRQMFLFFGRPFITVHHVASVAGLILITIHPLALAFPEMNLSVFIPAFDSLENFLRLGGRPAWFLFGIAALVALLRRRLKDSWRIIHFLNYVAFGLATVHGIMIGTDFQYLIVKAISILMTLAVIGVFVRKRLILRRAKKRSRG